MKIKTYEELLEAIKLEDTVAIREVYNEVQKVLEHIPDIDTTLNTKKMI